MNPRDHIRVRMDESGVELTILAGQFAERYMTKLDKPALGANGLPLPEKRHEAPDQAKERRAVRQGTPRKTGNETTASRRGGESTTTAPKAAQATITKAEEA